MAEVVLDANVLVALLDERDVHAARAAALLERLEADDHEPALLDFLLMEAVSVLARRARERRTNPPDLVVGLAHVRRWYEEGSIQFLAGEGERLFPNVIDTIEATGGTVNFNDALLVVLQREGVIGDVASFDEGLAQVAGFRRVA
jgi:predicted nucleic acid-binding protein